ncbi:hypothetical protein MHU86_13580 [Fragilaria crotonensis]|nr:hypothetical protein MHU86_13580 [Fragilaria crotonensis]
MAAMLHHHRAPTVDDMLRIGLDLAGFHSSRQQQVQRGTNIRRFQSHYGSSPLVCTAIWEDLLTTDIREACVAPMPGVIDKFFLSLYFVKVYASEEKLAGWSKLCENAARKWVWFFLVKIQALKETKIVWPEEWANTEAQFLYSVDGVHCRTNEIMHPTLARNKKLYSHKFNQAGFAYELALSLTDNSLVWMNGPFLGSKHDVTIFRDDGLKVNTTLGKKGIADQGYRGEKAILCTPNSHDSTELRNFKSRARARHETFNSRIKNFACLDQRFRHGMEKHKICFEAVCVIVQYQLENGAPLFDV